jgi:hypothetical protein
MSQDLLLLKSSFEKLARHVRFETVLRYVALPMCPENLSSLQIHNVLQLIFDWLWRIGVRIILEVIVSDNIAAPYGDRMIERFLVRFDVEKLSRRWE